MSGPLEGVRVIDLSTILLGPYATQIMGDMGADVIKIESPEGDAMRQLGPSRNEGMASFFMNLNRNKRSLVLDLARPSGLAALKRLIKDADLFIHNLRAKPAAKLGITYQDLSPLNPGLVYCSTIGYNREGPYGEKPAYDDLIQGASGLAALMGEYLQGAPKYVPTPIVDKTAGLTALNGVLMALFHKARTGEGQEVEISMFETMASHLMVENIWGYTFDPPIDDIGFERLVSPYRKPFPTKDGNICVLPYTDRHWQRFFKTAGRPELITDERFIDLNKRTENTDPLYQILEEILQTRTTTEWLEALDKADIPCSPVNTMKDLLDDPHLKALNFFPLEDHPSEGKIRQIGIPTVFSKTPGEFRIPAPKLGHHSVEVLKESGLKEHEIQSLISEGVTLDGR